jgi:hypothetical protein
LDLRRSAGGPALLVRVALAPLGAGIALAALGADGALAQSIDIPRQDVTFRWTPPNQGEPAGYFVYYRFNDDEDEIVHMIDDPDDLDDVITGNYGDVVVARVTAVDEYLTEGPSSPLSDPVRFVMPAVPGDGGDGGGDGGALPPVPEPIPEDAPGIGAVPLDFNGDAASDLLLTHSQTGAVAALAVTGSISPGDPIPVFAAAQGRRLVGAGDFYGNGTTDLLWRLDLSGWLVMTPMLDYRAVNQGIVDSTLGSRWEVVDIADYDGDRRADLLLLNEHERMLRVRTMMGTRTLQEEDFGGTPRPYWRVAGSGDFDGDGRDEVLWVQELSYGSRVDAFLHLWRFSDDLSSVQIQNLGKLILDGGGIAGVGDFDGDGIDEILQRSVYSGALRIRSLGLAGPVVDARVPSVGGDGRYTLLGIGDYDSGAGGDDLVLSDRLDHHLEIWHMNGFAAPRRNVLSTNLDPKWDVVPFMLGNLTQP